MPAKRIAATTDQPSPKTGLRTYEAAIEETCTSTFPIRAANPEEALTAARKLYRQGRLVLKPGEHTPSHLQRAAGRPAKRPPGRTCSRPPLGLSSSRQAETRR